VSAIGCQTWVRLRMAGGWRLGLATGAIPQALLLLFLLYRLSIYWNNPEERPWLVLLLLANLYVIPVCYVVAGVCVFRRGAVRNFRIGVLVGSTVAAVVFSAICLATTMS
jgi:hypothetical protein